MTKLSEMIVKKIKKENIVPVPKWKLLMKSSFIWAVALMGVILGAVAVAVSIHLMFVPLDTLPEQSTRTVLWQNLSVIPYFWLFLILLFVYIAYHNFIHTEDGYKWKTVQILIGTVLASILLGLALLFTGFAPWINSYFVQNIPGYTAFGDMRGSMWMNPQGGRLAGTIVTINSDENYLILKDLSGSTWKVTYTELTFSGVTLAKGEVIKIVGKQTNSGEFSASEFRQWEGNGMMNRTMQGKRGMMRITN